MLAGLGGPGKERIRGNEGFGAPTLALTQQKKADPKEILRIRPNTGVRKPWLGTTGCKQLAVHSKPTPDPAQVNLDH